MTEHLKIMTIIKNHDFTSLSQLYAELYKANLLAVTNEKKIMRMAWRAVYSRSLLYQIATIFPHICETIYFILIVKYVSVISRHHESCRRNQPQTGIYILIHSRCLLLPTLLKRERCSIT